MSLKRESTVQLNENDSLHRVIEKKSYPLRVKGGMILGMVFAMSCRRAWFVMPDVTCTNMNRRIYKYKQQSAQPFESGLIFLDPTTPSTTRNTDKRTLVYSKEGLHWCKADQKLAARIICGARNFDHVTVPLKELRTLPNKSQLKSVTQNSPMMSPLLHTSLRSFYNVVQ